MPQTMEVYLEEKWMHGEVYITRVGTFAAAAAVSLLGLMTAAVAMPQIQVARQEADLRFEVGKLA